MIFSYQFSLDNDVISNLRQVYGVLDFIGDIGGLTDGLEFIASAILSIIALLGD